MFLISAMDIQNIIMLVILVVAFAAVMAVSVVSRKKREKEYTEMQNAIRSGTRIMTIGRLVGTVTTVNTDNTIEVDVGAKGSPVIIVINRDAIQTVLGGNSDVNANFIGGDVDSDENAKAAENNASVSDKKDDDAI